MPLLILAPLRGTTDHLFRTCFAAHFDGFDSAMAPFIPTTRGETVARSHLRDIVPENNPALKVIPQAIGNNADELYHFACHCRDLGYTSFNWNLGCPFQKITHKKRGSGLLPHPDIVQAILESAMPRLPIKLSLKVRLGLHDEHDLETLLPILNRYPIEELAIHARTADQQYEGTVNLAAFERCCALTTIPVVYNGDITTHDQFKLLQTRFPAVSRFMIGRGAVADPFLPGAIKGKATIDNATKRNRIKAFYDDLYARNATVLAGSALHGKMKEWWGYIALSFHRGKNMLKHVQRTKNQAHYEAIVRTFFDKDAVWVGPGNDIR